MIRLAMFGAGRIAKVHAQTIKEHPMVTLDFVVDPFTEYAEAIAKEFGASVTDTDSVFSNPDIDAVLICSSTNTHADLIEKAALTGKAIFCEKPVDLDISRARDVAEIVKKTDVTCFLGFNRRFDPTFMKLKEQKDSGRIGNLEQLVITSRDPAPPPAEYCKTSGGLFRDMMIHDLDMARWMLGEDPVEVYAAGSSLVDPAIGEAGDVDSAHVTLKTASGKLCHINNSRRAVYGYDQRIEALGSEGMLQAANHTETQLRYVGAEGEVSEKPLYFFLERYMPAFRNELKNFVDGLVAGEAPSTTIEDGVKSLELANACLESLTTGTVVKLS